MAKHRPREEFDGCPSVNADADAVRLLDGIEDNLLRCRKQETPRSPQPCWLTLAGDGDSGTPADTVAGSDLAHPKPVCGAILQSLGGQLGLGAQCDHRRTSTRKHSRNIATPQ